MQPQSASSDITPTEAERAAMRDAIDRALKTAHETGKSGIAATVMRDGQIIATGENEVYLLSDPTKHAEMVAITRAAAVLQKTDLSGCTIISTLQPCAMCLSAIRFAKISRIIFAATQAHVPSKYFAFPHLHMDDFQNCAFEFAGGIDEARVLHLYANGAE